MSKDLKIIFHGQTDQGLVREHNEDYILWDDNKGIAMLADGMGGHNAGEVASELAVNSINEALEDVLSLDLQSSCDLDFEEAVGAAVVYANEEINLHAKAHPECNGMGTTVVVALFQVDSVILANVGDSRIYRFSKGELSQVSTDHSLVQEMVDNGYMSEEEAQASTNRNLITRALGIAEEVNVDVWKHPVQKDDIYLLCSDGLSDLVKDDEIFSVLVKTRNDLERASEELIELAKEYGGSDNISVILAACK